MPPLLGLAPMFVTGLEGTSYPGSRGVLDLSRGILILIARITDN